MTECLTQDGAQNLQAVNFSAASAQPVLSQSPCPDMSDLADGSRSGGRGQNVSDKGAARSASSGHK